MIMINLSSVQHIIGTRLLKKILIFKSKKYKRKKEGYYQFIKEKILLFSFSQVDFHLFFVN